MPVKVFHRDDPDMMMPMIARDARLVVWPGRGSQMANMNYVHMQAGERNVPHVHTGSEDTLYVISGSGVVEDIDHGTELEFRGPCAVHIPVGIWHAVRTGPNATIESVGGPSPADWNMLVAIGAYECLQ